MKSPSILYYKAVSERRDILHRASASSSNSICPHKLDPRDQRIERLLKKNAEIIRSLAKFQEIISIIFEKK